MRSSDDLQLGELAVKLGYLTTQQLGDLLGLAEEADKSHTGDSFTAILVKHGLLTRTQVDHLKRLMRDGASALSSQDVPAPGAGASGAAAAGDAERSPASGTPSSLFRGLMELPFVCGSASAAGSGPPDGKAGGAPYAADSAEGPAAGGESPECVGRPFGRYVLHTVVGRGGMGIVWKAWDSELRRYVALKLIRKESGSGDSESDRDTEERFLREAQNAAKLQHPHIVHIYDVGVCEGERYFTMDFLEGEDLGRIIERHVKKSVTEPPNAAGSPLDQWPLEERLDILREVASALDHAHSQGIVHRDLKPANIILTPDRGAVVTDFGLAKDVKRAAASGITISGQTMGTPAYMSPEQALGKTSEIGLHSDIFSLGTLM
ncbi:MAG: serine/threonine-protein kinase, partial [Planctomycetota bacterium]|nr:serine/threonine-protein kinase [Planctomycetota bacterium]